MALFNDLFTESSINENATPDYLKDLPLAKFAEGMSFLDMGSKGLVLAEAGWTDICESVSNMDALNEDMYDVGDKIRDKAEKAGSKIKSGAKKIVEFLKKVPGYLKKIAQNIFGTINKFLTSIAALVKGDQNILDIDKAKKGLARYKSVNSHGLYVKGFMFADKQKAVTGFAEGLVAARDIIDDWSATARSVVSKKNPENAAKMVNKGGYNQSGKTEIQAAVRHALFGAATGEEKIIPDNGAVTSKSFKTDITNAWGKKYSKDDKYEVDETILNYAIPQVKGGYKDGQKAARALYKDSREQINKWIKQCEDMQKFWEKQASDTKDNDSLKESYNDAAKAAEIAGSSMMRCAGIMSSFTGSYCQLLHQEYTTLKSILTTCVGYAKGGKVGEKVYGESDVSIFGLELI